jgi:hypothetical protein
MISHLPRHTGEAGRGRASIEVSAKDEIMTSKFLESGSVALPLPTLPRMTGEEIEAV